MDFYGTMLLKKANNGGINLLGENSLAFKKCLEDTLTSITEDMLDGISNIRDYAFYGCAHLESITIPSSVTNMGDWTFFYCTSLTTINMLPQTPPTLGVNALQSVPIELKIYVPAGTLQVYRTAPGWSPYGGRIVEADNLPEVL